MMGNLHPYEHNVLISEKRKSRWRELYREKSIWELTVRAR